MHNHIILCSAFVLLTACNSHEEVADPNNGGHLTPSITVLGTTGDSISYRVQGLTSVNGQVLSVPGCLSVSYDSSSHLIDINGTDSVYHHDKRVNYIQDGTCGARSPYNGGWIDVYEVDGNGDHYVGQVYGDLAWRDFWYRGSSYLTIKLRAFPDQIMGCSFQGFDGYGSQNPITVTGAGDLPLAQFYC